MKARNSSGIGVCTAPVANTITLVALIAAICFSFASGCDDTTTSAHHRSSQDLVVIISPSIPALTAGTTGTFAAAAEFDPEQSELAYGQQLFLLSCASCHGTSAQGLPHQGAKLRNNRFIADHTDEYLLAFLRIGRQPQEPENTTGVRMPPRGNPSLDDDQLRRVLAFLRHMQQFDERDVALNPEDLKQLARQASLQTLESR